MILGRRAVEGHLAFVPGDSFVHGLDPRTRMATVLVTTISCLAFETPLPLVVVLLLVGVYAHLAGLLGPSIRALTAILPLLATIVVIDAFFPRATYGEVFFSTSIGLLHPILSTGSIIFAVSMGLRLVIIAWTGVLFVMTTAYTDLVRSLKSMGLPNSLTFSLGYALRSTTWLAGDLSRIVEAQSARGLALDRRSVLRHPSRLLAMVIPMTVVVLARSRHVTDAMQARGYGFAPRPTCYRRPIFHRNDLLVGSALAAVLIGVTLQRFAGVV
jgi:energy-coupling factor transport system permease protein